MATTTGWLLLLSLAVLSASSCAESGPVLSRLPEGGDTGGGGGDASLPSAGGGGGSAPYQCGEYTPGSQVEICAATYLGTTGSDSLRGVAISSSGRVFVAGQFPSAPSGFAETSLVSGVGPGALMSFDQGGREAERIVWVSETVTTVDADAERARLVVGTATGVAAVADDLSDLHWQIDWGSAALRVDVAPTGDIAVLDVDGWVRMINTEGEEQASFLVQSPETELPEPVVSDVALSAAGDIVYVVGAHDDASGGCQGRIPFLRAYDGSGQIVNRAYDFDSVDDNCASSMGRRVSLGNDGMLYYGGENQGGNTVHLLDPRDINRPAPLVSYDLFSQGYGQAIQRYGFVARFEPSTLEIETGQLILPRNDDGEGGEFLIDEVLADSEGQIAVLGRSTCCSAMREDLSFDDVSVGAYGQAEVSLLLLSADLLTRRTWLTPTLQSTAVVEPQGMAWEGGLLAIVSSVPTGTELTVHEALASERLGDSDGHLLTMPAPSSGDQ